MFIVMEFIDGKELKHIIADGPLSVDEATDITIQIARGLEAAHKRGIIHRDIKSTNIMLTADGQVKIMDFGLAKLSGDKSIVTKAGTTLGTAAYMSPEQAQAIQADHRTDLWSMGIVLFEMLTGQLPFQAEHEAAWTYAIVNEHPPTPGSIDNSIPPYFDSIVLKLLEKDRESRYQSAEEVLKSLQDVSIMDNTRQHAEKEKAIAVLPFENISPDKETDYFADGLAEELIINLGESKLSVKALKDALAGGFKDFEWIKRDPDLDSIRKEPVYINLMKGK